MALSGYSGLDGFLMFPWSVPHVHFNVWLNGVYTDPFAAPGETSLWLDGNAPKPHEGAGSEPFEASAWNAAGVEEAISMCLDPAARELLASEPHPGARAMNVLFQLNYYPTRFSGRPALFLQEHPREPRLSLPFLARDFSGTVIL